MPSSGQASRVHAAGFGGCVAAWQACLLGVPGCASGEDAAGAGSRWLLVVRVVLCCVVCVLRCVVLCCVCVCVLRCVVLCVCFTCTAVWLTLWLTAALAAAAVLCCGASFGELAAAWALHGSSSWRPAVAVWR